MSPGDACIRCHVQAPFPKVTAKLSAVARFEQQTESKVRSRYCRGQFQCAAASMARSCPLNHPESGPVPRARQPGKTGAALHRKPPDADRVCKGAVMPAPSQDQPARLVAMEPCVGKRPPSICQSSLRTGTANHQAVLYYLGIAIKAGCRTRAHGLDRSIACGNIDDLSSRRNLQSAICWVAECLEKLAALLTRSALRAKQWHAEGPDGCQSCEARRSEERV